MQKISVLLALFMKIIVVDAQPIVFEISDNAKVNIDTQKNNIAGVYDNSINFVCHYYSHLIDGNRERIGFSLEEGMETTTDPYGSSYFIVSRRGMSIRLPNGREMDMKYERPEANVNAYNHLKAFLTEKDSIRDVRIRDLSQRMASASQVGVISAIKNVNNILSSDSLKIKFKLLRVEPIDSSDTAANSDSMDEDIKDSTNVVSIDKSVKMQEFTVKGVTFTMVQLPGGTFAMGSSNGGLRDPWEPNETPRHDVTLSPFCIGQTEVTQELWHAVMGNNPSKNKHGEDLPVEYVSYNGCLEFINRLNKLTKQHFRLPTEAEWEYAARGGQSGGTQFSGGDELNKVAWNAKNCDEHTHKVGTKHPNNFGLYDMSGNVREWCEDWYADEYNVKPQKNPKGPKNGDDRVIRGGSYHHYSMPCRVAYRDHNPPNRVFNDLGLRLAL